MQKNDSVTLSDHAAGYLLTYVPQRLPEDSIGRARA